MKYEDVEYANFLARRQHEDIIFIVTQFLFSSIFQPIFYKFLRKHYKMKNKQKTIKNTDLCIYSFI